MGVESLAQEHNTIILPELESQCYILQSRESNINPLCVRIIYDQLPSDYLDSLVLHKKY